MVHKGYKSNIKLPRSIICRPHDVLIASGKRTSATRALRTAKRSSVPMELPASMAVGGPKSSNSNYAVNLYAVTETRGREGSNGIIPNQAKFFPENDFPDRAEIFS